MKPIYESLIRIQQELGLTPEKQIWKAVRNIAKTSTNSIYKNWKTIKTNGL